MKKILIFTVPFGGHLNILKHTINRLKSKINFKLVITGWKNILPEDLPKVDTVILAKSTLKQTDPALWTFPRVAEQLGDCIKIAREFKPDLIIYDFFSLEGYFVGKLLKIPYWCSIPAMIGPFTNKNYLKQKLSTKENQKAIKQIREEYDFKIDKEEIELISDGLHLPGQKNLVLSYSSLVDSNYLKNRKKVPYLFVGNIRADEVKKHEENKIPLIYFSLGTVVMNNLWNQQKQTRNKLKMFILGVAKLFKNKNVRVVFVSQGKKILKTYPKNWNVFDRVNQMDLLSKADVFITHGGSNSFHEAVLQKVPMIVIPFFGDQPLVGERVKKLGIGINLGKDKDIDTKKSKNFLNLKLAKKLSDSVFEILSNTKYRNAYKKIKLKNVPIKKLVGGKK
ncbi:glycosyltransferase family 1 protein [Candidatus Woesearchaeota archaeon]|nr:glycosyltransferase family 1 protein [Candidatus Woesearchaeota archaeon]